MYNKNNVIMRQEIYFDEMVLGNAVWDIDVSEYHDPIAWCGTPWVEEVEKRSMDLFNGMYKDLDEKSIQITKIKEKLNCEKENYDLGFGGDGFDREEY
jgi:hypothetical protein